MYLAANAVVLPVVPYGRCDDFFRDFTDSICGIKLFTSVFDLSEHNNDLLVLQQWCIILIIRGRSLLSRRTQSSRIFKYIDLSRIPVQ